MFFGKKKESVIDRRLRELQKEMRQVENDMKVAATAVSVKAGVAGPGGCQPGPFPRSAGPAQAVSSTAAPARPASPPDNDLFAPAARGPGSLPGTGPVQPTLFDRPEGAASPFAEVGVRKKFANYFMAGHFQNLRPSRQESRILRNKAIVTIILVLVLVLWLVYYLQTH